MAQRAHRGTLQERRLRKTRELFSFSRQPELQNPSLIVGFSEDAGRLAPKVIDCLNAKIKGESFCEIELSEFFPLGGVAVEDNIAQFPESKFYCGERNDLVIFKGSEPRFEWYQFLQTVLDVAEHHCKIKELYTISGTISSIAHTTPRSILTVFNRQEFQKQLRGYGLKNMNWEGQPALNSFLLWVAERRNIPGVSLWPVVPFYLAGVDDSKAQKKVLEFLDKRFGLGIDFSDINEEVVKQNEKIAQLRSISPEVDNYIQKLESNLTLNEEESEKIVRGVAEFLRRRD